MEVCILEDARATMAAALKTLIVPPTGGGFPSATVFLIHGLGDTAHGWLDVARMLGQQQALHHVRFVLPTAPVQPVTINMGMPMTSWFDSTYPRAAARARRETLAGEGRRFANRASDC